jgi:hypothetical protein
MDAAEPRVEAAGISLPPPHDLTAARGELTTIAINGAFSTCPGLKVGLPSFPVHLKHNNFDILCIWSQTLRHVSLSM